MTEIWKIFLKKRKGRRTFFQKPSVKFYKRKIRRECESTLFQFADFQITEVILKIVGRFFEDGKVKRMSLFCIGDAETLQIVGALLFCPAGGMDFQIKNRADGIVEGGKRPECGSGFC